MGVRDRATTLHFINGRLMQKEMVGDGMNMWDEKYVDVTEEVKAAIFGTDKPISSEEFEQMQST